MFKFVMFLWFLFIAALWIFSWASSNRPSGTKSDGVAPNPQMDSLNAIFDMKHTFIKAFNDAFPEILRIERRVGGSRYLQDYDPDYFELLKGLKALSQMPYVLSIEQAVLVKRCLQMNETEAMFRHDKDKVLEPNDIEFHTQHQQVIKLAKTDFSSATRHLLSYEKQLETLKICKTSNDQEEDIIARRIEYQNEVTKYKQQQSDAISREDAAKIILQDFRLTLLNKLVDPSEINDTTLNAQLSDFSRYSELVYNP